MMICDLNTGYILEDFMSFAWWIQSEFHLHAHFWDVQQLAQLWERNDRILDMQSLYQTWQSSWCNGYLIKLPHAWEYILELLLLLLSSSPYKTSDTILPPKSLFTVISSCCCANLVLWLLQVKEPARAHMTNSTRGVFLDQAECNYFRFIPLYGILFKLHQNLVRRDNYYLLIGP